MTRNEIIETIISNKDGNLIYDTCKKEGRQFPEAETDNCIRSIVKHYINHDIYKQLFDEQEDGSYKTKTDIQLTDRRRLMKQIRDNDNAVSEFLTEVKGYPFLQS